MTEKSCQSEILRRDFIIYSCASAALCLLSPSTLIRRAQASAEANYYMANRERFHSAFEKTVNRAHRYLFIFFFAGIAEKISKEATEEFSKILPGLPYIGGDNHWGTKWILLAGHWLSFFKAMSAKGYAVNDIALMMYDLYVEDLDTTSSDVFKQRGMRRLSDAYIGGVKMWADNKSRRYKEDWIADFVSGDGSFDYGLDYLHCPCAEYFKSHDAKLLAPYFCLVDFPEHKRMGTGLVRTKTIAQGDKVCNFRFKKGRQVLQDWSTEAPKLRRVSQG